MNEERIMKNRVIVLIGLVSLFVLVGTSVLVAGEVKKSAFDDFKELSRAPELKITFKSLKILAQVSREYRMQADCIADFYLKDTDSISLQSNPFYIDVKHEYEKIINLIKEAKQHSDVGYELERIMGVAEWRLSELCKPQAPGTQATHLGQAETEDELNKIIANSSGETRALAKEKLENLAIETLKKVPSKAIFVIPELQPLEDSYTARISVVAVAGGGEYAMFSTDRYPHDGPMKSGKSGLMAFPFGNQSVHRYEVEYSFTFDRYKYRFVGNKEDPLTFILMKGVGYAYLHGKGRVITPDGREVILPPKR